MFCYRVHSNSHTSNKTKAASEGCFLLTFKFYLGLRNEFAAYIIYLFHYERFQSIINVFTKNDRFVNKIEINKIENCPFEIFTTRFLFQKLNLWYKFDKGLITERI